MWVWSERLGQASAGWDGQIEIASNHEDIR